MTQQRANRDDGLQARANYAASKQRLAKHCSQADEEGAKADIVDTVRFHSTLVAAFGSMNNCSLHGIALTRGRNHLSICHSSAPYKAEQRAVRALNRI